MSIRYCAYAFEAEDTEQTLRVPGSMMARDPLGDAWGIVPGRHIVESMRASRRS